MKATKYILIILLYASFLRSDTFNNQFQCLLSLNPLQCSINPCLKQTCSKLTIDCISNYCGGCYFSLLDENDSTKPDNLGSIKETAPLNSKDYGRFKKPLSIIDFSWVSPPLCDFITQKNWNFIAISTPHYFIVSTIINLNYIANVFAYIYDRINEKFYHYSTKSLLAIDIKEKPKSSILGCFYFYRSSSEFIRHCYNQQNNRYEINANIPMNNNTIQVLFDFKINFSSINDQSMVLLYPYDKDRPAYTHHTATLFTEGTMKIGNIIQENSLSGLSRMDWTLSYPRRVTRWKWASFSTQARDLSSNEYITIGINLSDGLYNDKNDISMENAVWINGQVYMINYRINIESPSEEFQTSQLWNILTVENPLINGPKVQLNFQPKHNHEEHDNLLIIVVDFVQIVGIFNGIIQLYDHTYAIENSFGVVENQYAKW